jgi:hypothetical protein
MELGLNQPVLKLNHLMLSKFRDAFSLCGAIYYFLLVYRV